MMIARLKLLEDKLCYSGGAFGSDFLFDQLGCELGYKTVIWSFRGHNRNETKNSIIKELTQKELNEKIRYHFYCKKNSK